MKKRLLMQLFVLACVAGAGAVNVGDYIYTPMAKYRVTGANVVTNGTFSEGIGGLEGWVNENGGDLNGNVWGVVTNQLLPAGVSGNALQSLTGAGEPPLAVTNVWPAPNAGLFTVSYWVKGVDNGVTSISATTVDGKTTYGTNYINFFVNRDATNTIVRGVSDVESFTNEWKQIVDTVELHTGDYLVFNAANLATGMLLTGFELHEVVPVYDTRIGQRYVDYVESVLAEPDFAEGADEVRAMLEAVKGELATAESEEAFSALLDQFKEQFDLFVDSKAASAVGIFLTDWTTWAKYNWNSFSNAWRNEWYFMGARWGFSANDGSLERPEGDGYVASAGIQTSFDLSGNGVMGENALLPPGRYMFQIEAQAVAASGKAQPYGANHSLAIVGPQVFVGTDTLKLESDTISGYYWKTYYHIAEVAEGDTVRAGFIFPTYTDKRGGRYSLRNPQLRAIGKTAEELQYVKDVNSVIVQQEALKLRLELAREDLLKTKADGYPWGHADLQQAIDDNQAAYDASLLIVDADGHVLEPSKVTSDYADELLENVRAMNSARNAYEAVNKVYQTLLESVATAKNVIAAPENAGGDKAPFQAVIDEADALLAAVTENEQVDEYNEMIGRLLKAQQTFSMSCATYANPALINIENGDFTQFALKTKVGDGLQKGWYFTYGKDARPNNDVKIEERQSPDGPLYAANVWRGTTVGPDFKANQRISITEPGIYEYRAKAFGTDDTWSQYMGIATIIYGETGEVPVDTTYCPNIRLFFGLDGAPDSVVVSKSYNVEGMGNRYFCTSYAVFFEKTDNAETTVEFGFEGADNSATAGANAYGFGDSKVFYVRNVSQYIADAKEAMNVEIQRAYDVIAVNEGKEDVAYLLTKMRRYISAAASVDRATNAETAKNVQNITLSLRELQYLVGNITSGIEPTLTGEQIGRRVKGIYTITGVKLQGDASSLKPGLYIIDGKKHLVK